MSRLRRHLRSGPAGPPIRRAEGAAVLLGAVLFLASGTLEAQQAQQRSLGVGAHYHGYSIGEGAGADGAELLLFPVAYRHSVGERLRFDLYSAWATGRIDRNDRTLTLQGPTDSQVRASYRAAPNAMLTASVNLPTGNSTHDAEEALVASTLSGELLGFREATWGTGFGITSGVTTARQFGEWGVGLGASYRLSQGYEPRADTTFTYEPGNEVRLRLGLDRDLGEGGRLTAGLTFQNFATDQVDGRNLFQAGNRVRADASYAFRSGGSTWTLFGANVWRERGDVFLSVVDPTGAPVSDTVFHTRSQNLVVVGAAGSIPVGAVNRIRPSADLRIQSREDDVGSGWVGSVGADVPLRVFGTYDLFPRIRLHGGSVTVPGGGDASIWGLELGTTVRWRP